MQRHCWPVAALQMEARLSSVQYSDYTKAVEGLIRDMALFSDQDGAVDRLDKLKKEQSGALPQIIERILSERLGIFRQPLGGADALGETAHAKGNSIEAALSVVGELCVPQLGDKWMDAQGDALVDGKPAITAQCSIACQYGGIITFIDDGQEV